MDGTSSVQNAHIAALLSSARASQSQAKDYRKLLEQLKAQGVGSKELAIRTALIKSNKVPPQAPKSPQTTSIAASQPFEQRAPQPAATAVRQHVSVDRSAYRRGTHFNGNGHAKHGSEHGPIATQYNTSRAGPPFSDWPEFDPPPAFKPTDGLLRDNSESHASLAGGRRVVIDPHKKQIQISPPKSMAVQPHRLPQHPASVDSAYKTQRKTTRKDNGRTWMGLAALKANLAEFQTSYTTTRRQLYDSVKFLQQHPARAILSSYARGERTSSVNDTAASSATHTESVPETVPTQIPIVKEEGHHGSAETTRKIESSDRTESHLECPTVKAAGSFDDLDELAGAIEFGDSDDDSDDSSSGSDGNANISLGEIRTQSTIDDDLQAARLTPLGTPQWVRHKSVDEEAENVGATAAFFKGRSVPVHSAEDFHNLLVDAGDDANTKMVSGTTTESTTTESHHAHDDTLSIAEPTKASISPQLGTQGSADTQPQSPATTFSHKREPMSIHVSRTGSIRISSNPDASVGSDGDVTPHPRTPLRVHATAASVSPVPENQLSPWTSQHSSKLTRSQRMKLRLHHSGLKLDDDGCVSKQILMESFRSLGNHSSLRDLETALVGFGATNALSLRALLSFAAQNSDVVPWDCL